MDPTHTLATLFQPPRTHLGASLGWLQGTESDDGRAALHKAARAQAIDAIDLPLPSHVAQLTPSALARHLFHALRGAAERPATIAVLTDWDTLHETVRPLYEQALALLFPLPSATPVPPLPSVAPGTVIHEHPHAALALPQGLTVLVNSVEPPSRGWEHHMNLSGWVKTDSRLMADGEPSAPTLLERLRAAMSGPSWQERLEAVAALPELAAIHPRPAF